MHTRRACAFLIGAWLLGSLLVSLFTSQSLANVDRLLSDPPPAMREVLQSLGSDVLGQTLRHGAAHLNRRLIATWNAVQLGLGAALLVTAILTVRRSKVVIVCTLLMLAIVAAKHFYLRPVMNALAAAPEFHTAGSASALREQFLQYSVWARVLEIFKLLAGLAIAVRLLFDRYEWAHHIWPPVQSRSARRRHERLEQI
jgi:hypothetical protein